MAKKKAEKKRSGRIGGEPTAATVFGDLARDLLQPMAERLLRIEARMQEPGKQIAWLKPDHFHTTMRGMGFLSNFVADAEAKLATEETRRLIDGLGDKPSSDCDADCHSSA